MKALTYRGKRYQSVREIYDALKPEDLSYAAFIGRIQSGRDIENVLATPAQLHKQRKYVVDGKTFANLNDLAKAAGISYEAAYKRLQRDWPDDQIFHGRAQKATKAKREPKPPSFPGKPVTLAGITYQNLRVAYDSLKPSVKWPALCQRLRRGWSLEEALNLKQRVDGRSGKRKGSIVIQGERMTIKEAAARYAIPKGTIRRRKLQGATDEQAVGLAKISQGELRPQRNYRTWKGEKNKPHSGTAITVDGVEYPSIAALARAYGLPKSLVWQRITMRGWDPKRAATDLAAKPVEVDGIRYRSAEKAWEAVGKISYQNFSVRRAHGHAIKVCLGLDPLPKRKRYEVDGKWFPTIEAVGRAFGLSKTQLVSRMKQGRTLEEAIAHRPISGRYSSASFEADPQLGSKPALLYFVRIPARDGELHKIGITTRSVKSRFAKTVRVIATWYGTLFDLYRVEQQVIEAFESNHYRAEEEFDGHTETFSFLPDEEAKVVAFVENALPGSRKSAET